MVKRPKKSPEVKHIAAWVPVEKHIHFSIIAARRGLSRSELLREALDELIMNERKKGGRV